MFLKENGSAFKKHIFKEKVKFVSKLIILLKNNCMLLKKHAMLLKTNLMFLKKRV